MKISRKSPIRPPRQRLYAGYTMLGARRPIAQYKINVVMSQYYKLCSTLNVVNFMNSFFQRK
jgi:hypothetical protein